MKDILPTVDIVPNIGLGSLLDLLVTLVGLAAMYFKLKYDIRSASEAIVEIKDTLKIVANKFETIARIDERLSNLEKRQQERLQREHR